LNGQGKSQGRKGKKHFFWKTDRKKKHTVRGKKERKILDKNTSFKRMGGFNGARGLTDKNSFNWFGVLETS